MNSNSRAAALAAAALLTVSVAAVTAQIQQSDAAGMALQRAIRVELVDGDPAAAIGMYEAIVSRHAAERAVVASALLHMGDCHRKLDDGRARAAYLRVVNDYPDQARVAAQARRRLDALPDDRAQSAGSDLRTKLLLRDAANQAQSAGSVSPDGRELSIIDFSSGNIALMDLASPTHAWRRLTNDAPWSGYVLDSIFSPDGEAVAYHWQDWSSAKRGIELRLVKTDGTGARVLVKTSEGLTSTPSIVPEAWSPDGSWILALASGEQENTIVKVPVAGDPVSVIRSLDWRAPSNMAISPDGGFVVYDLPVDQDRPDVRQIFTASTDWTRETPLVPGTQPTWTPDGSVLFVREGDLWVQPVLDGRPDGPSHLVKPFVGDLTPLGFSRDGAFFYSVRRSSRRFGLARYDADSGRLVREPEPDFGDSSSGADPRWSPKGDRLAYVQGRTVVVHAAASGSQRKLTVAELTRVSLGGWAPDDRRLLVYGPEPTGRHAALWLDTATGERELAFRSTDYLSGVRLSRDGASVYYHPYPGPQLVSRRLGSGARAVLVDDAWPILFELSPDGTKIAFSKKGEAGVHVLDVASGRIESLAGLPGNRPNALEWTSDGRYLLIAMQDGDQTWRGPGSGAGATFAVWRVALDGSGAVRTGLTLGIASSDSLRFQPDGRRLTFQDGEGLSEIYVMENLMQVIRRLR